MTKFKDHYRHHVIMYSHTIWLHFRPHSRRVNLFIKGHNCSENLSKMADDNSPTYSPDHFPSSPEEDPVHVAKQLGKVRYFQNYDCFQSFISFYIVKK